MTTREIRYRMTRAEFDVMSVFGCLLATEIPGPAFVVLLAHRGYSASSVRNQLRRMVQRGVLQSSRQGRYLVYRRGIYMDNQFNRLSGDLPTLDYTGTFPALIVTISESDRSRRDRVVYLARRCAYRPIRAGVLIALDESATTRLRAVLADEFSDGAGIEPCTLVPHSQEQARSWVQEAFGLTDVADIVAALETRVATMIAAPDLDQVHYFDVFHAVSTEMDRVLPVPRALVPDYDADRRLAAMMRQLVGVWVERFSFQAFNEVAELPEAGGVAWDLDRWKAVGAEPPDFTDSEDIQEE